jgi:hypothetical protein
MNVSPAGELGPIKKLKDGKYHLVGDPAITPRILLKPMYAAFFTFTSSLRFRGTRTFWSLAVKTTRTLCQSAGERRRDKAGRLRYHGRVGPDRQDGQSEVPLQHRIELRLLRYSGHPNKRGGWPPYNRGGNGGVRGGVH